MEIRSHFSLRVQSSLSGCRESQTKSILYFDCARATGIVAPFISMARPMKFQHRPGTSHFALGRMHMAAILWLACESRAYAQPRRQELQRHEQRFDKPRGIELDPSSAVAGAATARHRDHGRFANAFPAAS